MLGGRAGQTVYEWSQAIDEINIYMCAPRPRRASALGRADPAAPDGARSTPPPGVGARDLDVKIATAKLQVGLKGNPPFLNEEFSFTVKEDESFWTLGARPPRPSPARRSPQRAERVTARRAEDGVLHIQCEKVKPGEAWPSALKGHQALDAVGQEESKKAMMLQRFQKENPGFDFSGADFNGQVPDATQFMGGMKTTS